MDQKHLITGKLYLIPSALADGDIVSVIPEGTLKVMRSLKHFIVEELRTARRFLIKAGTPLKIDDITFFIFNEHSTESGIGEFLKPVLEGHSVGLLSEAGVPCVADPGSKVVQYAHSHGVPVVPLTGPSSILLALMASGFNGQNFAFMGYLPVDRNQRIRRIRETEQKMRIHDQTQIFIETPYRNLQLFESLVTTCSADTMLCLATELSGEHEQINSRSIQQWKNHKPDIHKRNTIFLLYHS